MSSHVGVFAKSKPLIDGCKQIVKKMYKVTSDMPTMSLACHFQNTLFSTLKFKPFINGCM